MSKKKLHTYCILEGHLHFYLDKLMVRATLGGFWETWGGLWGGLGRTLGKLLGGLEGLGGTRRRRREKKQRNRSKKRKGRSNTKEAAREKEEATQKKQEERRENQHERKNKKSIYIYIQTPDQPLLRPHIIIIL